MPTPYPPELLTTFTAMAEVVYAGESFDSIHESLCHAAVQLVDGCDHASLMLSRRGHVHTAAASDDVALAIDALRHGWPISTVQTPEPVARIMVPCGLPWRTLRTVPLSSNSSSVAHAQP